MGEIPRWRTLSPRGEHAETFHRARNQPQIALLAPDEALHTQKGPANRRIRETAHELMVRTLRLFWSVTKNRCARFGQDAAFLLVPEIRDLTEKTV